MRARDERKEEQKMGLEVLQQCGSMADLQKLWKRPPDSLAFSQSSTSRWEWIADQLKPFVRGTEGKISGLRRQGKDDLDYKEHLMQPAGIGGGSDGD